jgi:DNA-directed RNA polymerase specialized sigma24 family protein
VAPDAPQLAAGIRGGMTDRERLLDELRPVAFAIAYRMLGSVSEAEDIVQEVLLRLHRALEGCEADPVAARVRRHRAGLGEAETCGR